MAYFRESVLRSQPLGVRLVFGAVLAVAAALLTSISGLPQHGSTFLLLLPAVFIAAFFAGRDAGITATLVAIVAALPLQLQQNAIPGVRFASLLMFAAVGVGTSVLLSLLKGALRDAEQARLDALCARDEADLLMRELRHRTKNDIANIDALLLHQAQRADPVARAQLELASARLGVVRRVHEKLTRTGAKPAVEIERFLHDLCSDLNSAMAEPRGHAVTCDAAPCLLTSREAIAIGLMVNELVTNAIKYAYGNGQRGQIAVRLQLDEKLKLTVQDDGSGWGNDAQPGTGQRLIKGLCRQLTGKYTVRASAKGTLCTVTLPLECAASSS